MICLSWCCKFFETHHERSLGVRSSSFSLLRYSNHSTRISRNHSCNKGALNEGGVGAIPREVHVHNESLS
jgi:hypothetical protein